MEKLLTSIMEERGKKGNREAEMRQNVRDKKYKKKKR